MIRAMDVVDGQVKGIVVANDTPGFCNTKLETRSHYDPAVRAGQPPNLCIVTPAGGQYVQ